MFLWDNCTQLTKTEAATIEHELIKRASFFGITNEFNNLKTEVEKRAKVDPYKDLPNSEFALVLNFPDGTTERHYPLRNGLEIKAAAHHLHEFQNIIPLIERQKIAQRILDKAAIMGAGLGELEDYVDKQAGYGTCAASDAADLLRSRAAMLRALNKLPDVRSELEKMAQMCDRYPEQVRSRDSLVKLAGIVDNLDRACGLVSEYDNRLDRPEDILFGVSIKTAEHFVSHHCESITGNMYKVADLRKVSLDTLRGVFGDEFADSVSSGGIIIAPEKLADQISALPRPDAEMLDRILEKAGISPIAKKTANDSSSWKNRTFLRKIADHR
jgi:hypothetical protein